MPKGGLTKEGGKATSSARMPTLGGRAISFLMYSYTYALRKRRGTLLTAQQGLLTRMNCCVCVLFNTVHYNACFVLGRLN